MSLVFLFLKNTHIENQHKIYKHKWKNWQNKHGCNRVTNDESKRPTTQCRHLCCTSCVDSSTVQHQCSKHIPLLGGIPLAGGATAFLRLGGGTFFSGSGFLGTTGT